MGEVYLAQDTLLARRVAVKVLPAALAADPEHMARFEQEARAAAALSHPNIAAVFDVGAEGDTRYFVQEYLTGTDLRGLLESGRPKLEQTLDIAAQIARALTVAHRAGIVHRDLKPENVFITEDGTVRVLDFGLAKVRVAPSDEKQDSAASPADPAGNQRRCDHGHCRVHGARTGRGWRRRRSYRRPFFRLPAVRDARGWPPVRWRQLRADARDGEWIAVAEQDRQGVFEVTMHRTDLSGEQRFIELSDEIENGGDPVDFSPDGRTLFVHTEGHRGPTYAIDVARESEPVVIDGVAGKIGLALSPDGRWFAFTSDEGGSAQVQVLEVETGRRWPVVPGSNVRWRAGGRELFYWADDTLYAVPVRTAAGGWATGPAEKLFEGEYVVEEDAVTAYDASPDGQRFYLIRDDSPPGWPPTRVELVLDAAALIDRQQLSSR